MIYSKSLLEEFVLCLYHVVVFVLRKMRSQAIAWFAGFTVSDIVWKNHEIMADVEKLAWPEKHTGELRREKLPA